MHLEHLAMVVYQEQREREVALASVVSLASQDPRDHRDSVAYLEHQEDLDRRQISGIFTHSFF